MPNERSLHSAPTPRTGGLAILAGVFFGAVIIAFTDFSYRWIWISLAVGAVAVVSVWDDHRGAHVGTRFLVHISAALLLLGGGMGIGVFAWPGHLFVLSPWLGAVLTVLFVIWLINLYNFMDGMDGLAAGMAVIGFIIFAALGWSAGVLLFTQASLVVAAASLGFLLFNFAPARIFMGDVGSASLGLLVGLFSIWGARAGIFPIWAALLVFSPFIVDATVTLLRRLMRGEKLWQAHKTHYYQRLVQLGWGHRKTALAEYAVMLACGMSALWALHQEARWQWAVLGAWALFYFAAALWIDRKMPLVGTK